MLKFFKDWALPIAMMVGIAGYPFLIQLHFLMPYLIFTMLLLTFSKMEPKDLKIEPLHIWLLILQIGGSIAVYLLIAPFNTLVAQGAMMCVIAPTATSAAVITGKLGGSSANVATFTLLSNIAVAITVPALFPLIEPHKEPSFWIAFCTILSKVFPLLICPFLAAWAIRAWIPGLHRQLANWHNMAFYLWTVALAIVTAITLHSLLYNPVGTDTKILLGCAALISCCLQFFLGKTIGSAYGNRISGGQAMGQKNTVLAIWIAHTYLNPISSIGPGTYVLWQNAINSWQLWKKQKREKDIRNSS